MFEPGFCKVHPHFSQTTRRGIVLLMYESNELEPLSENLPDRTTFVISASIFMSPRARNNCRVITLIHVTELAACRTRETDHGEAFSHAAEFQLFH